MNKIEIIYQEGKEDINEIWKFLHKPGVWTLFGNTGDAFECLNVGKSDDIGGEILYDISCLHNLKIRNDGTKQYINQFGEDCGFKSISGLTQEYLYPYIRNKYDKLIFMKVFDKPNRRIEQILAWLMHARYWRNGGTFKRINQNYYNNVLKSVIQNRNKETTWKTEEDIITFLENFQ